MTQSHKTQRVLFRAHWLVGSLTVTSATLLMSACDNPAPGEGMPKPLAQGPMPEVVSVTEALQSPDLTTVDPGLLHQAEVDKVLPPSGLRCSFAYTAEGRPVLTAALLPESQQAKAVMKLHGRLVVVSTQDMHGPDSLANGAAFSAEGLRATVRPERKASSKHRVADMTFELDQGLLVGYRGWYSCDEGKPAA
ncbi:MAG: hypothetical protein CME36_13490 [unclassified Hahellaceae]|nr:hypothetical protein [Hahellaceae bacterium]|tara:strand:- start:14742 stop:15320 length:579 start_codon:yes stop_codon:yes gene_type:complete